MLDQGKILSIVAVSVFGVLLAVYVGNVQKRSLAPSVIVSETISSNTSVAICPQDIKVCADGSYTNRDPYNNCNFKPCPTEEVPSQPPSIGEPPVQEPAFCTDDVKLCANGEYVSRNPENSCQFNPCAEEVEAGKTYEQLYVQRPGCKGDFDKSWKIDINDLAKFAQNYRRELNECRMDIIGGDCQLDVRDLSQFARYYKDQVACRL